MSKNTFNEGEWNYRLNLLTQCEIWLSLVKHKADVPAGTEERHTQRSPSTVLTLSLFSLYYGHTWKPSSHRYVAERGSRAETALFARMGNSLATISQKQPKGRSVKLSDHNSVSVQLFPPVPAKSCLLQLYGLLTQSRQSVEREGNNPNSFCSKVCRCVPIVSHSAAPWHFWVYGNISRSAISTCRQSCNLNIWTKSDYILVSRFSSWLCIRVFRSFKCRNISAKYASHEHQSSLETNLASSHLSFVITL